MWLVILQRLALEFLLDIIYFPVWWYTAGAKRVLLGCAGQIRDLNFSLSPGLWLKNIFVPMFGQYDWQGRIVSFFMRLVNVLGRTLALVVSSVVVIVFFFVWLLFPVVLLYLLTNSLFS